MRSSKKQIADQLGRVPLFARCSQRSLRAVARHVEVAEIPEGTAIVDQDHSGDTFFIILHGEVDVVRSGTVVTQLGAGDHLGELSLLDSAPRSATVVAGAEVEIGMISLRMFRVILRDVPELSLSLLASLAAQLRLERAGTPAHAGGTTPG